MEQILLILTTKFSCHSFKCAVVETRIPIYIFNTLNMTKLYETEMSQNKIGLN